MRVKKAVTGPSGAAGLGLDGFRDQEWPLSWCTSANGSRAPRVIRTGMWRDPVMVDGVATAPHALVLRHIGTFPEDLRGRRDGITPMDRLELAVEHALRLQEVTLQDIAAHGGSQPGDVLLRQVLARRDDPVPTESYAETRAIQRFRPFGIRCWKQMRIWDQGRVRHRADLVIPRANGSRMPRKPEVLRPDQGLLVEIDSREFHERQFERDHQRQTTYDALGFHWVVFTPTQIEQQMPMVRRAIDVAMARIR